MALLLSAMLAAAAPPVALRRLIHDTRAITRRDGDALWPGFARIPFHMILVERRRETLFCHAPLAGFRPLRRDAVTGCTMQQRPRANPLDISAAFPVADEPAMIVVGAPARPGSERARWAIEVAHEAFHQYQARLPDYAAKVQALGLAGSSGDGAWMLDYPFPYAQPAVEAAFVAMCGRALAFLQAPTPAARRQAIAAYVAARHQARAAVSPADWRYYEFQIGQEGVARWTDVMLAQAAARRDPRYKGVARDRLEGVASSLKAVMRQGLRVWKRGAFYELGAVEAMMLDSGGPGWRAAYRDKPFGIGDQLDAMVSPPPA